MIRLLDQLALARVVLMGFLLMTNSALSAAPNSGEKVKKMATETAILAGGCFWGMEEIFRTAPGVVDTEVGYTGGSSPNPTYQEVKSGTTGHAEAIRVNFDPAKTQYGAILDLFFKMHDPTTANRQGNDVGSQYRSVIFFLNDAQKLTAERKKREAQASGRWKKPIVTEIVKASEFYPAEDYHQDYLVKNPGGYTCHWIRN
jgi:methionine-S-sulfoxide reductase